MNRRRDSGTRWARIALVVALCLPAIAAAQQQDRSIDLTPSSDLHFGSIIASPTGGTVVVSPDGMRTTAGVFGFGGFGYNPGVFEVTVKGRGNAHYQIVLPASVTLTSGGSSMTVDTFQSTPAGTGHAQPPAGIETLRVGATLRVGPNQPGGNYAGTYFVTVHLLN